MPPKSSDRSVYDALLAVKPEGLKLGTWARQAGLARNFFNDLPNHNNPKQETIDKLLDAIGVSRSDFEAGRVKVRTEVASAGLRDVDRAYRGENDLPALPLVGSAIGGEHGDLDEDIELVELDLGEVLEWLARPASLGGDKTAYALTILSDSMSPKFEPGERVAVSPKAPISIGDYVIVQLRGREGDDDRIKTVLVKRLLRRGAGFVELCQFNPEKTFRIELRRVAAMHRVKGTLF